MNINIQSLILGVIILLSIVSTMRTVLKNKDLGEAIDPILSGISTIITFFIVVLSYEKIDLGISKLLSKLFRDNISNSGIVHIIMLGISFIIIKLIIEYFLNLLNRCIFRDVIEGKKSKFILSVFSIGFGIIRGMIFIILVFMSISIYNTVASPNKAIQAFDYNKMYMKVSDIVDKSQIISMSNGIQEKVAANRIVYYNGITIDEGVKSNDEINAKAQEITKGEKSEKGKAKTIYTWIGSNISYDDEKAEMILNEGEELESGAIAAFKYRKGICLDYACLYTAMAKSVGLKTRIIIGEAYNGEEYVSHAWNQVYIPKEDRWINIDTTFYVAGDYFDSSKFETQYRIEDVAGEF